MAAAAPDGTLPAIRVATQQLAILCDAAIELWTVASDERREGGWRLLMAARANGAVIAGLASATAAGPPDRIIIQAATELLTSVVTGASTAIALPLVVQGRLQGVLLVQGDAALAWRVDLELIAPFLGLVLHSLHLRESRVDRLGDPEAAIADQAQFHDALARELARARRACQSFALLMIGLDRYESLGHELGVLLRDRAVQSLVPLLRQASRDGDIIGRYSPDAYLVLLPDSTVQGAQIAARRHLNHVYRRPVMLPDGSPCYLDISIGIAIFPVDGVSIGEMVENAASAMREAQRLGGKRAVAA